MYLYVAVIMLAFTFFLWGADNSTEETTTDFSILCADNCFKVCCLGCKATKGNAKCIIVLADGSMPCCVEELEF